MHSETLKLKKTTAFLPDSGKGSRTEPRKPFYSVNLEYKQTLTELQASRDHLQPQPISSTLLYVDLVNIPQVRIQMNDVQNYYSWEQPTLQLSLSACNCSPGLYVCLCVCLCSLFLRQSLVPVP